jgi:hypothetical protein
MALIKRTEEKNGLLFLSESICHSKIYSKFIERRANLRMESSSAVKKKNRKFKQTSVVQNFVFFRLENARDRFQIDCN